VKPLSQYQAIRTQQEYHELVATGMAWELFPGLEATWTEFQQNQQTTLGAPDATQTFDRQTDSQDNLPPNLVDSKG
jgi:hypothetical protein